MRRRDLLAAGAVTAALPLAGCTARVTGWSSLRARFRNDRDSAVDLRLTVAVNGERALKRRVGLPADSTRRAELRVDVPWDGTLAFRATLVEGKGTASERWDASIPLYGGNKCTIEPAVLVDSEGVDIGPACM